MIGTNANFPYVGYTLYKVFHKDENRFYAVLVNRTGKHRTTIQWAKYLLEVHIGRFILEGYEVHHLDGNSVNDELSNLEEKLGESHKREHAKRPITHGTPGGYRRGCRCELCTIAKSQSQTKWRLSK